MIVRTTSAVAVSVLLTALAANGQQTAPPPTGPTDQNPCFGSGPITGGMRQAPTPDEVRAREASPGCSGLTTKGPAVDDSPQAGRELDSIYGRLQEIDRSQTPAGAGK